MDLLWLLAKDAFWSAIPAVGFAMLFNVPPRMLKYCAMGGALAHSLRTLLIHYGMPIEWATLAAATTVGFVCVYWSRLLLAPRPVFSVASHHSDDPRQLCVQDHDRRGGAQYLRRHDGADPECGGERPQGALYCRCPQFRFGDTLSGRVP